MTEGNGGRVPDRARGAVRGLAPYQPGMPVEVLERELGISGAIKLASNENPRGPGPAVQAAISRAAQELTRYPDGNGFLLKQDLAETLGVRPEQLTLGNGSNDVLELLARVFVEPGCSGVVDAHSFVVYPLAITSAGGRLQRVASRAHGHDLEAMAAAIDDSTRIVYVANPNNPTGTRVDSSALEAFLERVPSDVVVVLDEAYREYIDADDHPDGLALLDRYANLVVTRTFSKIHGLAALRIGYAVSDPEIADLLNRVRQPFNVNALALAAARAALQDTRYVEESRRLNDEGLAQLRSACEARQLAYIPSWGNFLTIDMGSVGADAQAVHDALLQEGVIVRPVANYGLPDFLRVSVGLPEENARFVDALDRVLAALTGGVRHP